ncbi:hypothetical protein LR48_Vigan05g118600 [Vigna angularis]|uniref:Uncharacterized protein n=1 Tax=Phaseolus angularis TaxID=3914 RepID=A0A0L9ULK9_PHAAN|nr:hypothetical protein LR48_Vigan05g118600 [Vigna angularis]
MFSSVSYPVEVERLTFSTVRSIHSSQRLGRTSPLGARRKSIDQYQRDRSAQTKVNRTTPTEERQAAQAIPAFGRKEDTSAKVPLPLEHEGNRSTNTNVTDRPRRKSTERLRQKKGKQLRRFQRSEGRKTRQQSSKKRGKALSKPNGKARSLEALLGKRIPLGKELKDQAVNPSRQRGKVLPLGSSLRTPSVKPNGKARSLGNTPKSKTERKIPLGKEKEVNRMAPIEKRQAAQAIPAFGRKEDTSPKDRVSSRYKSRSSLPNPITTICNLRFWLGGYIMNC